MRYLLVMFILPLFVLAQNNRKIFIETGTTINIPFKSREVTAIYNYPYQNTKYYTTVGFYAKFGIDMMPKAIKKFYVTVPFFASYKEFNGKIKTNGTYRGFPGYNWNDVVESSSKSITISIGPKFNFEFEKLNFYTSLNFNVDVFFMDNYTSSHNSDDGTSFTYRSSSTRHDVMFSSSIQVGLDYKLTQRWAIGFSVESYVYNFNPLINNDLSNTHLFNFDYSRSSSLFCTGIRGSYKF